MSNVYQSMSVPELLEALERAGRLPTLDLLRACLEPRAELTPTLLEWLAFGEDADWDDDDPRFYRQIHAGHLLLEFREPQAIPIFMQHLRAQDNEAILEWFETKLASFGLPILEPALELLADESASEWGRVAASEILTTLAKKFPDERAQILAAMYQILPALDQSNNLLFPPTRDDEPPVLWTFIATNLAKLGDLDSRPLIKQLYDADLMDEGVMGDYDDYFKYVTGKEELPVRMEEFDILSEYEHIYQQQQRIAAMRDSGTPSGKDFVKFLQSNRSLPTDAQSTLPQVPFVRAEPKIGRNDPCPCGSGRKFKKCHGK